MWKFKVKSKNNYSKMINQLKHEQSTVHLLWAWFMWGGFFLADPGCCWQLASLAAELFLATFTWLDFLRRRTSSSLLIFCDVTRGSRLYIISDRLTKKYLLSSPPLDGDSWNVVFVTSSLSFEDGSLRSSK